MLLIRYACYYTLCIRSGTHANHTIRMLLIRYAYAAAESLKRASEGRGSLDAVELRQKLMVREAEVKALSVI
jgi:hypothetical protein